ncbi:hypothetical protein BV25DRAFT_1956183 [Artomyces pyxidatus]|uniref:Uncharacterized protein n=1 Tax=Artomyces pyxidatus TaxID=48021 RepID=A0ACB8SWQ3_9AGAM|nr:hypothetical protein BV25DRAFT_1956183 [Artomyces pyxidatus]
MLHWSYLATIHQWWSTPDRVLPTKWHTALVDGFLWEKNPILRVEPNWRVEDPLQQRVRVWAEEARAKWEEEELRKRGTRWMDSENMMDINKDELELAENSSGQSDDEEDSDKFRALKAPMQSWITDLAHVPQPRQRYLQSLLQPSQSSSSPSPLPRHHPRTSRRAAPPSRPTLQLRPEYTVLVMDMSILLLSLAESGQWTIIIPLPVIKELNGLGTNDTLLGEATKAGVLYLTWHICQYATSLKVQTSQGNYLSSLSVRSEQVDFDDPAAQERNMDDLILKAAIWQDQHWQDRSSILRVDADKSKDVAGAAKVVLLSLHQNSSLLQLNIAGKRELSNYGGAGPSKLTAKVGFQMGSLIHDSDNGGGGKCAQLQRWQWRLDKDVCVTPQGPGWQRRTACDGNDSECDQRQQGVYGAAAVTWSGTVAVTWGSAVAVTWATSGFTTIWVPGLVPEQRDRLQFLYQQSISHIPAEVSDRKVWHRLGIAPCPSGHAQTLCAQLHQ